MLDLNTLRTDPDLVKKAIQNKGLGDGSLVDRVLDLDTQWRQAQTAFQDVQTQANALAKDIGVLMKAGQRDQAQAIIAKTGELKGQLKTLEAEAERLKAEQNQWLLEMPNIPHESVPIGATPAENVATFTWGEKNTFAFPAKPHWELLQDHQLADFERGAKVTGAGFPFYHGVGARLQRALIQFFLDTAIARGYTELQTPLFVNEASALGTGQLPDKEDLMYEIPRDQFFLIPTAEVSVTNFLRDEILDLQGLPIKYCAYTPCFRREAGSYGKDVRGLNRLHQFDKVELVHFVTPEASYDALESLREDAEFLLQTLGLPYRRLLMCTGDMGFTQSKKYDLEVWSAAQARWLEVSSISNYEAFQARRANIRFRDPAQKKPQFVHTLNGSGLALPRIVAALLENNQQADGTIHIPEAFQAYTGFAQIG